jgi:AraC-like DNA-binding protein
VAPEHAVSSAPVPADLAPLASKLCASLFSGGEIEHARAHAIASPFVVAPHAHGDLVQFDWIVNCRGSVTIDGATTSLAGACSFVLIAPKRKHAMTLEAASEGARVYHTRIALPPPTRRSLRVVSSVATGLPINTSLEAALNDVWRLTVGGIRRPLLRAARMAEAIALWPGTSQDANDAAARISQGLDRDLDAALQAMERSLLGAPPSLESLADIAGLSVRHFTRRFRDSFGIPPIEFLDRKRLALAQQMLAYESAAVGEVAERMGFSSPAVFSRWFANLAQETPTAYRQRPHAL